MKSLLLFLALFLSGFIVKSNPLDSVYLGVFGESDIWLMAEWNKMRMQHVSETPNLLSVEITNRQRAGMFDWVGDLVDWATSPVVADVVAYDFTVSTNLFQHFHALMQVGIQQKISVE